MLGFFRRNLFVNYILLLIFCVALQAYYLFEWSDSDYIISLGLFEANSFPEFTRNHIFQTVFSIILIFLQASLIGRYVIQNKLSRALSLIPAAVFALLASFIMEDLSYDPILLANFFFVLSMGNLYDIYKKYQPVSTIYNSGLFLALAAIIYFPYILFLIVLFFGLISLRSINIKETLQLILGFLTPWFFAIIYLYFVGNSEAIRIYFYNNFALPPIDFSNTVASIKLGGVLFIILTALLYNSHLKKKKKFDAIKKIELCYWMLFVGLISIFCITHPGTMHLMVLSFPLAILIGLLMEKSESVLLKEFMFLLSIVLYFMLVFDFL